MATYSDIQTKKNQLIRKGLDGGVFVGASDADELTASTLFDGTSGGLVDTMPTGYNGLGWLTDDGAQFSRSVDSSDITGWGSLEPLRSDRTSDVTMLQVACEETNAQSIGLYIGVDAASTTAGADGSIEIEKPAIATVMYHRVFSLSVDSNDSGEIYIVRFLPRAKVTDFDDQAFANGDSATLWSMTFTAYTDSTLGYSEKYMFGGPGWNALLADMGFTAPA